MKYEKFEVGTKFEITSKDSKMKEQYSDITYEIVSIDYNKQKVELRKVLGSFGFNNKDYIIELDRHTRFKKRNQMLVIPEFNYESIFEVEFKWFNPDTKRIFRSQDHKTKYSLTN